MREASGRVRVSAHLSDAQSGAHLWADTYDRDFGGGIFAAQDDIVSRIAATVADAGGVLVRTIASRVRDRRIEDLDADELVLRYHGDFVEHFDAADHAQLRDAFEAVVAREPGTATAWACLAMIHALEIFFDVNPKPDPLARLRRAAERANTLDPTIQHGWVAMATAALFDRDRAALQAATDRALALNPCHTRSLATLGLFTAFSGDTTRGMQLMDRSLSLNPRHPGWYLLAPFLHEYERGNFNAALGYARRIGMPKFVAGNLAAAAAAGQVRARCAGPLRSGAARNRGGARRVGALAVERGRGRPARGGAREGGGARPGLRAATGRLGVTRLQMLRGAASGCGGNRAGSSL